MEFPSVVEAAKCAIEVRCGMNARNAAVAEDRRILFRIGINIGDVIVEGDDIYGEGVNVAARLESLADLGGICVGRNVRNELRGKLDVDFADLGEVKVKNITRPINAFSVTFNKKADALVTPVLSASASTKLHTRFVAMTVVLAVVLSLVLGLAYWQTLPPAEEQIATVPGDAQSLPSVIVLPFDDLSLDGSLGYFADGMTEDITTELARWKELRVIARIFAFLYKDKAVDVREIAQEMNVRYVLEGSIRRAGDKIRINAQLIDGRTGNHVWADKFDQSGTDVLALQDQITSKLAESLSGHHGTIRAAEYLAAWDKSSAHLEEYDYYLRGHDLFFKYTPQSHARALEIFQEGLVKFPDSGLLKVIIGWIHMIAGLFGWADDIPAEFKKAAALADEGLADEALPPQGLRSGLWLKAYADIHHRWDCDAALRTAKTVVDKYPFDPESLIWMGDVITNCGEFDLANKWIEAGFDRSPHPLPNYYTVLGILRYRQERYEEAIAALKNALDFEVEVYFLAASYAALGQLVEAHIYTAKLSDKFPHVTPDFIRAMNPDIDPNVAESVIANLAKAGWPE